MVLKPPEMLPALAAGNIDCFIAWEPHPAQAETAHAGAVIARSDALWKEHPCCVLIAGKRFALERPEDTEKIIHAHRRASRFIIEQPEEALSIAVRYTGMPRDIILQAMAHMRYSTEIDPQKTADFAAFLSELNYLAPSGKQRQLTFFTKN